MAEPSGSWPAGLPGPVRKFLERGSDPVLLDAGTAAGRHDRAAVVVRDRLELRSLAPTLPDGVRARAVAVCLTDAPSGGLSVVPRPEWPALVGQRVRQAGGVWLTVLRFAGAVDAGAVVAEVARQSVYGDRAGHRGLRVQRDGGEPATDVPPDVVSDVVADVGSRHDLGGRVAGSGEGATGMSRSPLLVSELDGPLRIGPLDERVLNPIGFDPTATGAIVDLADLDLRDGPTEAMIAGLRAAAGVRVTRWDGTDTDTDAALRVVAGLAMAGVPVVAPDAPVDRLGEPACSALSAPVDLGDALAREEHSIVLRRGAHDTFSDRAWRREAGRRARVPVAGHPGVSVVLATKRPEMLEHAVGQVARQRGVERLELVLAPHGFEPDAGRLRELLPASVALQVLPQPEDTLFGDVLQAAARAAAGDVVLKMDDDDWYSPDFVADLLLARAYSGAELVGMPAELHYLEQQDLTVRRGHPVERYAAFVAGGTMLVERAVLREVGGFRSVRKFVDAQLLADVVAAGGAVYRTHGLGYLLRRTASGHTWEVDLDYLLDPARVAATYDGLRPSRLMEL